LSHFNRFAVIRVFGPFLSQNAGNEKLIAVTIGIFQEPYLVPLDHGGWIAGVIISRFHNYDDAIEYCHLLEKTYSEHQYFVDEA